MSDQFKVSLLFKLRHEPEHRALTLTSADYLDPLDPGEALDVECVPKHAHAHYYVTAAGHVKEDIEWTLLHLSMPGEWRSIRTDFYPGGAELIHTKRSRDGYEELIHSVYTNGLEQVIRTCRTGNGAWRIVYHFSQFSLRGKLVEHDGLEADPGRAQQQGK